MSVSSAGTIAAMQAVLSPSAGDVVEVAGHMSSDDGGGGTFFFDTTRITNATVSSARITGATYDPIVPSPIVITAIAHPYVDGQSVLVQGVGGNTNANGVWLVEKLSADTFVLLGSLGNAAYTSGGTATSVTVTTSAAHRLSPGGRAMIERVTGAGGFSLNGGYLPIGTVSPTTFTLALAPTGSYSGGGAVGDGGLSFPSNPSPVPVPSAHPEGRWVRRRDDTELNVKWFGVIGDGVEDDTESLVATIRAARTFKARVYLPGGNFRTTGEIKLETYNAFTDHGLSIRGEGAEQNVHGGTQLTAGAGMRSILSVHAGNVTIKGVRFQCGAKADHGLYLQGAGKLHLDDVHVLNALKDGYRVARTNDDGKATNNDGVYARELSASTCGTMYCSASVASRYGTLRAIKPVEGTVSCTAGSLTISGSGTRFTSVPARGGDFILIGAADDSTLQRLEIAKIVDDRTIEVHSFIKPSLNLSGQPFAIGVGDGWSEETHNDNNRARMDTGNFTSCAGSGVVCRGLYGPLLEHQEFFRCGFAGIVIGTLNGGSTVSFSTRISNPYFESTFYGGCIFLAQARGITIDQPMWLAQPDHRRLVVSDIVSNNSGIIGLLADYPNPDFQSPTGGVGLHPLGSTTRIDVPATQGRDFTNVGTFKLPSAGAAARIGSSPYTTPIPIPRRNLNLEQDLSTLDGPADIKAIPTFPAGSDGQEIAVCNIGKHPLTFHDSRGSGLATTLVLDCEPGGAVSLAQGQIMMLYYSTANFMKGKWTQRGAIATDVPVLSSLDPKVAHLAGGDSITITGTNLARATAVIVGSSPSTGPITITANTATALTFTMPPRSAGAQNVLVTTGRGASNVLPIEMR
jgi:hypothetical protein